MSSYDLQQPFVAPEVFGTSNRLFPWRRMRLYKTLFVGVSVMDVVLTFCLLNTGSFYESNPIANQILQHWGFLGMTLYKLLIVSSVMMIANIISIWRVNTSRFLLAFGTVATAMVVAYSVFLFISN